MATITQATHAHTHDISHEHTVSQTEHAHTLYGGSYVENGNSWLARNPNPLGATYVGGNTPDWSWAYAVGGAKANISVDPLTKNSGNASTDAVYIEQTDHSHQLAKFGYGNDERVSVTTTPPYQAIYTWYRDS